MIHKDFFLDCFSTEVKQPFAFVWMVVGRFHQERVLQGLQLCNNIVVLGEIAHSDVKGNVSLHGRLNPKVFIDQVRCCCKLFKYIFHKESCCSTFLCAVFVVSAEAILFNFVGCCGLPGSIRKSRRRSWATQSPNPEHTVSISTLLFLIYN